MNFINHHHQYAMLKSHFNKIKIISQLYSYLWPKDWGIRLRFIMAGVLLFVSIGLDVGVPLILKQVIATISIQETTLFLAEILLISYGLAWTLNKIIEQLRFIAMNRVIERGIRSLTLNIFNRIIQLSVRFHSDKKTGEIINIVDRAQFAFPGLVWGLLFFIFPTLLEIILAIVILIYLYGMLYGIILALILMSYIFFSISATNWSVEAKRIANEKSSQVSAKITDSLLNYETIRYFVNQEYENRRCNQFLIEHENAATKEQMRGELVLLGQGVIMGIGLLILTWLSGTQVMTGALHVSDFVLINIYLLQFMTPLSNFGYIFRDINQGLTNLEGVLEILDKQPEIQDVTTARDLIIKEGSIIFDNVSFSYDERRPILKGISFKIPAKKITAIVGSTGSGKSTITHLLFRYYDVSHGRILVDGEDIRNMKQLTLQSAIGVVSQNTALFNETLRYNILYGHPGASNLELGKAIKQSHLDDFIASLPEGLDTLVGEHGFKLSGGEKQRVAIARVLLKKPRILIFDEATSSLDTKTEHIIQQNIEEIAADTTTLIIAHRLSTVIHADQILVLDHGTLVEQGTHNELLNKAGIYAELWEKQTAYQK